MKANAQLTIQYIDTTYCRMLENANEIPHWVLTYSAGIYIGGLKVPYEILPPLIEYLERLRDDARSAS